MGLASWLCTGLLIFLALRLVRSPGTSHPRLECLAALTASGVAGLVATALDFGGWKELEWRSAAFSAAVALSAVAIVRIATLLHSRRSAG